MHRAKPAFYASIHVLLMGVARDCGYAVGIHGSAKRDLDLIMCPWTEDAVSGERLMRELANAVGGYYKHQKPKVNPHGRVSYALVISQGGGDAVYVDVSIMPRSSSE